MVRRRDGATELAVESAAESEAVTVVGRFGLAVAFTWIAFAVAATLAVLARARAPVLTMVDAPIRDEAHETVRSAPLLLEFVQAVTHLGDTLTLTGAVVVAAVVLVATGRRGVAIFVMITSAGGGILNVALKELVDRARPSLPDPVATASGLSFPSGHAMGSTVTYGALLVAFAPLIPGAARWIATVVVAVLVASIAASRVFLGVHYLSDVTAGVLLGLVWLALVVNLVAKRLRWLPAGETTTATRRG